MVRSPASPFWPCLKTDADLDKFKGKLKGKIVLLEDPAAAGHRKPIPS